MGIRTPGLPHAHLRARPPVNVPAPCTRSLHPLLSPTTSMAPMHNFGHACVLCARAYVPVCEPAKKLSLHRGMSTHRPTTHTTTRVPVHTSVHMCERMSVHVSAHRPKNERFFLASGVGLSGLGSGTGTATSGAEAERARLSLSFAAALALASFDGPGDGCLACGCGRPFAAGAAEVSRNWLTVSDVSCITCRGSRWWFGCSVGQLVGGWVGSGRVGWSVGRSVG